MSDYPDLIISEMIFESFHGTRVNITDGGIAKVYDRFGGIVRGTFTVTHDQLTAIEKASLEAHELSNEGIFNADLCGTVCVFYAQTIQYQASANLDNWTATTQLIYRPLIVLGTGDGFALGTGDGFMLSVN